MATESLEYLLCHTAHVESFSGNPTRFRKCDRCGQHWDAERVAAVLNYKRWLKATMTVDHAA